MKINYNTLNEIINTANNQYDNLTRGERIKVDNKLDTLMTQIEERGNHMGDETITYMHGQVAIIVPEFVCEGACFPSCIHLLGIDEFDNLHREYDA